MKKTRLITLAIAVAVLAVLASSTASAKTWNYQTDVSEYTGLYNFNWYSWIDMTGTAYINDQLSWSNSLNNKISLVVKPAVIYTEDLDHMNGYNTTTNYYYSTLGENQYWSVIQYTSARVDASSARDVTVEHGYWDQGGLLVGKTHENRQWFTIV